MHAAPNLKGRRRKRKLMSKKDMDSDSYSDSLDSSDSSRLSIVLSAKHNMPRQAKVSSAMLIHLAVTLCRSGKIIALFQWRFCKSSGKFHRYWVDLSSKIFLLCSPQATKGDYPLLSRPGCPKMPAHEEEFLQRLYKFMKKYHKPITRLPTLGFKEGKGKRSVLACFPPEFLPLFRCTFVPFLLLG